MRKSQELCLDSGMSVNDSSQKHPNSALKMSKVPLGKRKVETGHFLDK